MVPANIAVVLEWPMLAAKCGSLGIRNQRSRTHVAALPAAVRQIQIQILFHWQGTKSCGRDGTVCLKFPFSVNGARGNSNCLLVGHISPFSAVTQLGRRAGSTYLNLELEVHRRVAGSIVSGRMLIPITTRAKAKAKISLVRNDDQYTAVSTRPTGALYRKSTS